MRAINCDILVVISRAFNGLKDVESLINAIHGMIQCHIVSQSASIAKFLANPYTQHLFKKAPLRPTAVSQEAAVETCLVARVALIACFEGE